MEIDLNIENINGVIDCDNCGCLFRQTEKNTLDPENPYSNRVVCPICKKEKTIYDDDRNL